MAKKIFEVTTPVGRMVGGDLYKAKTTDDKGQPLLVKSGPNKGQPTQQFSFGVAYPKTPDVTHWASETWLAPLWQLGHEVFAGIADRPDFSWKITDGDSTIPNKKNKRPCDQEGYPGHWVIWFSGSIAPKLVNRDGSKVLTADEAIKRGYYVQVMAEFVDNSPSESPGMYANPRAVALSAFGEEIKGGDVDTTAAGFGVAPLPKGASTVPVGGVVATPPPAAAVPPVAAVTPPPPAAVTPARDFASGKTMTAKAAGASYESFVEKGWSDALLREHGYMV